MLGKCKVIWNIYTRGIYKSNWKFQLYTDETVKLLRICEKKLNIYNLIKRHIVLYLINNYHAKIPLRNESEKYKINSH